MTAYQPPLLALLALAAPLAVQAAPLNTEMTRRATDYGCMLCHWARAPRPALESMPPPAPSFDEIGDRYRGRRGAEDRLVGIVMRGSGMKNRHWEGKTSAFQMPPNQPEIGEEEARKLIRWILR